MGKLAVYKYLHLMFLVLQIILTIFTITALFGGDVSPIGHTARALLVYALPVLIAMNVFMIFYWIVRRKWVLMLIPIITIACCIPYIGTLIQPRSSNEQEASAKPGLTVASYNVAMFGRETTGFKAQDILAEMRRRKVDVLCMQEYNETSGDKQNSELYREYFPYMQVGRNDMVIFSRYPITGSKTMLFDYTNNSAMWADVNVKGLGVLRVFNVHLQTTGINRTMHKASKLEATNMQVSNERLIQALFGNYALGMMLRASQANIVAQEQRASDKPCIVCGDFNDVPYSYVYNTMLGNMVDGFKECGFKWMRTFRGKKPVRIDYIFHDEALKGMTYYSPELSYSDHYPVFMKFAF